MYICDHLKYPSITGIIFIIIIKLVLRYEKCVIKASNKHKEGIILPIKH